MGAEEGADGFICVVRSFALALFSSSMNALALGSVPLKPELVDVMVSKLLGDHPGGGLNPNGTMCWLEGLGAPDRPVGASARQPQLRHVLVLLSGKESEVAVGCPHCPPELRLHVPSPVTPAGALQVSDRAMGYQQLVSHLDNHLHVEAV